MVAKLLRREVYDGKAAASGEESIVTYICPLCNREVDVETLRCGRCNLTFEKPLD
jgi:uncharacterized protein YlaI